MAATPPAAPAKPRLRIAAGSGAYADAYEKLVLAPFAAATSVEVIATAGTGNLDVVALDAADLEAKCASGELRELPADLAASDAVADVPSRCGIATFAWASVFIFDPERYAKRAPRTLKDVFNIRGYPGKRALPRNGRGLLEAALVADGVAASEIYARLATPEGRQQALAAVARLGSDIEWFDKADDALELLRAGKATIALTSNSRAFFDSVRRGPLEIIWDGQVYDVEYLAIPKSTANAEAAESFLAFATAPERLAAIARQIPYGPMRQQAVASVRSHAITGNDLQPFLPTTAANLASAVRFDPAWWRDNAASVASMVAEASRPDSSGTAPPLPTRQTQR
ncbi:MAG: extracellular solute-binding protein [Hyphomicrobiaceae bacterium]|nr:extracellular solute-binding protein [Hyphomicrobiaceae bacterium]